jgi:hypothetical protein
MVGDEVDERVAVQMLKRLERPDVCVWVCGWVRVLQRVWVRVPACECSRECMCLRVCVCVPARAGCIPVCRIVCACACARVRVGVCICAGMHGCTHAPIPRGYSAVAARGPGRTGRAVHSAPQRVLTAL